MAERDLAILEMAEEEEGLTPQGKIKLDALRELQEMDGPPCMGCGGVDNHNGECQR